MSRLTKQFGSRIRQFREKKNMSQLELAQEAGLDLTTVNELENGNREPMLGTISKVAKGLGKSISELFD